MPAWLDPELTTLAFCWRLARRDGVTLGFTSHDQDLVVDGLAYRATPGMVPSAIERSVSLSPDNVELSGVLTSDAIRSDDLAAGRWDGALLRLFAVDWSDPDAEKVHLLRGSLGTVQMTGDGFSAELLGPSTLLDKPVIEFTSPDCRAELGDTRCRVDMAGRSRRVAITSTAGPVLTIDQTIPAGNFAYGRLRWLSGANAGLAYAIASSDANSITLIQIMPHPVQAGDQAEIVEGCDRLFATCRARFANSLNFRGEPHLPGNDLLTRYVS